METVSPNTVNQKCTK